MKIRLLLLFILLTLILEFQSSASSLLQDNPTDVCQQSENILPNCHFNNGLDRWQTFTEDGSADFAVLQGGGECHAPLCPAGYIVTQSHFVGGIYQQVPVAKGNTYYANIVWLVFDSFVNDRSVYDQVGGIGRRLGIDPFGGTDPRSPNVIWGPENTRSDCKICDKQEVIATAQADTITLFLRIDDKWRLRAAEKGYAIPPSKDRFWIDDIGMKQVDSSAAPAVISTVPPPTDTPAPPPPTATPLPEPPVAALQAEAKDEASAPAIDTPPPPVETPTEIAQVESPEAQPVSPIATPTAVQIISPPPTLTPSATPSPTATLSEQERPRPAPTRPPRSTPEAEPALLSAGLLGVAGTTVCFGGVSLLLMVAVAAGLVWLYRLGWGKVDANESDDEEEIIIEVFEDDEE